MHEYLQGTFKIVFTNGVVVDDVTFVHWIMSMSGDMLVLFDDTGSVYNFRNINRMIKKN